MMGEEVTEVASTLLVVGLPDDVRDREIYNLFRVYEGYVSSHLNHTYAEDGTYQAMAFVVFKDQSSALNAKASLNGIRLDPQLPQTLRIDLTYTRPPFSQSGGFGGTLQTPGIIQPIHGNISGFPHTHSGAMMVPNMYSSSDGNPGLLMGPTVTPPETVTGSKPPCSTLFVTNLGRFCSERELLDVFTRSAGFRRLKMQLVDRMRVAFVEFQDTTCSTQALMQLQNMLLPSSETGGMRIEYAKSKMGLPKREKGSKT